MYRRLPSGHCVTSSGSNQTEIVQDPENPCGGHRILPLRVNEAGVTIGRSPGSSWTMRGSRSGKPPRRVNCYSDSFKYVLPDVPELWRSKPFVRPISGIHPLYTTDLASRAISAAPLVTAHGQMRIACRIVLYGVY